MAASLSKIDESRLIKITITRQYLAGGLSLREIAGNLNQKLIPTKQNGIWQANTVREILARV